MSSQHGQAVLPPSANLQIKAGSFWANLPKIGVGVGVIGLGASIGLSLDNLKQFYFSYLVAYIYFLSIALGAMFFVLSHYCAKAGWNVVVRRIAENIMGTMPLFVLLFIPIVFGAHDIFHHWTDAETVANDPILKSKEAYLNLPFFYIRAAFYLGSWYYIARYVLKRSIEQDKTGDHSLTSKLQSRAAPLILLYGLTQSYAAFDWIMSLDPHWYSTMFGVCFFAGSAIAIFSLVALIAGGLQKSGYLQGVVTVEHYHDLGKFLFGFVIFWTYVGFSQYMLIWYANIPEETLWFMHRQEGGWENVSLFLIIAHFILPMFFLLPRTIKRIRPALLFAAAWMLCVHYVDLYWQIMPVAHHHFHASIVDLTTVIGVGGFFFAYLGHLLKKNPLAPLKDPRLDESLVFNNP